MRVAGPLKAHEIMLLDATAAFMTAEVDALSALFLRRL